MKLLKIFLPLLVLLLGAGASYWVVLLKPKPETTLPEPVVPSVAVVVAEMTSRHLEVRSQGTVQARTETALTAEVSGRILEVSPNFREGGFFRKGELLLQIDPADYEALVAQRESALAEAELNRVQELALAEQAEQDWSVLGRGEPTALTLREPQLAVAEARVKSAQAALKQARRDLERTQVRAPYAGRVLTRSVDLGQSVSGAGGTVLARIYATDVVEVNLPLSNEELAFLDLPEAYEGEAVEVGPVVRLTAESSGATFVWQGRVVRSEGAIDRQTRLLNVVAEVEGPYRRDVNQPERPPLKVGLFVEAVISGQQVDGVFVLPRAAFITDSTVLVVDASDALYRREVEVLQVSGELVVVGGGLESGLRVVTSPVEYAIDGMPVNVVKAESIESLDEDALP